MPAQATATASVVLLHRREADSAQADSGSSQGCSLSQIVRVVMSLCLRLYVRRLARSRGDSLEGDKACISGRRRIVLSGLTR